MFFLFLFYFFILAKEFFPKPLFGNWKQPYQQQNKGKEEQHIEENKETSYMVFMIISLDC